MGLIDTRRSQMFPVLSPVQIETAKRFASGEPQRFAPGKLMFDVGKRHAQTRLILEGSIEATRHDGLGRALPIATECAGQFRGEASQFAGRPSMVAGRAGPAGDRSTVRCGPFTARGHTHALWRAAISMAPFLAGQLPGDGLDVGLAGGLRYVCANTNGQRLLADRDV
jgi:hypothetical protein